MICLNCLGKGCLCDLPSDFCGWISGPMCDHCNGTGEVAPPAIKTVEGYPVELLLCAE